MKTINKHTYIILYKIICGAEFAVTTKIWKNTDFYVRPKIETYISKRRTEKTETVYGIEFVHVSE